MLKAHFQVSSSSLKLKSQTQVQSKSLILKENDRQPIFCDNIM